MCLHLAENKRDPQRPFAFLATYAPRLTAGGRVQYRPLARALEDHAGDRAGLMRLLAPLERAAARSDTLRALVDSGDVFHPLAWTPSQAYCLLRDAPMLEESGLLLRLPDWWRRRSRPRVSVTIGAGGQLSSDSLLDFDVSVALDGEPLSEAEWRALLERDEGLVWLRGRWVEVDSERLRETLEHWQQVQADSPDGIGFIEGMRLLAGAPADLVVAEAPDSAREWSEVVASGVLAARLAELRDPPPAAPRPLDAQLRPYQARGRDWLLLLARLGLGACLADDMGLGKTVQVIALLLALRNENVDPAPSLLVLPASLLGNWKAELQRFAPDLEVRFVHPSELSREALEAMAADPQRTLVGNELVITTYAMLARQPWLLEHDWRLAILDEAQAIKNPGARQTRAVKRLRARARVALTGTPVENRLGDLWSLFDFLCPGLLGSAQRFRRFAKDLEARESERYAPLRRLVAPYILRRLKTDRSIIADLPEKTEMKAWCGLTRRQAALYRAVEDELEQALASDVEGIERRGVVLATLLRLKQICNHPAQLAGGEYAEGESGKFARLREIAEEVAARQERLLVFTQFRELTEPLAAFLGEVFAYPGLILHGGTGVKRRTELVERFQRDGGPPFMVLSLKAGGLGLNLTAASQVLHFDRWWNPAVENQATDRAFRIGQQRNVVVHKMVCRGTVEERIDALIEGKRQLAEDVVEGGGDAALTEMDDAQLLSTVALDIERATL